MIPLCIKLSLARSLDTLLNSGLIVSLWAYEFILVVLLLTDFQMSCVTLKVFFSLLFVLVFIPELRLSSPIYR